MKFYPMEKMISQNAMFVIEASGTRTMETISSFKNRIVYLQSESGDIVTLALQEVLYSKKNLAQAIFKPTRPLQPKTTYFLKYENQTEQETIDIKKRHQTSHKRKKLYWITNATADVIESSSNLKITYTKSRVTEFGCGPLAFAILEECEKLDPKNFLYPYEKAFAYVKKKEYDKAIKILKKTLKYENINSQVYQMLGNAYSYSGKEKKAIKTYEKGMEKFPNAGNLHLEKGNVFWFKEDYNEAAINYRKGIEADPMFPSNYYRLALLYLSSSDKLSGLIYAEIFMNLERTTQRTKEMSKLIYDTYKGAITLGEEESSIDFCEIVMDVKDLENGELTLPLCAIYGKHFILGMLGMKEVNSETIAKMRASFIEHFFEEDYKKYSNVLFDYHKKLADAGMLEAYTYYILQIGDAHGYEEWSTSHEKELNAFFDWYVTKDNYMEVTKKNMFIN
ncbi:hypothetical protein [uncultured Kordia sp.]|uniref:tetratricopeptide repeat protein n=1 Tax=uncultured Kordia sp. TaxID=507699 RepID=UPI00260EA5EC|nr:hypothetical protein [uncultured Kordia sp.]